MPVGERAIRSRWIYAKKYDAFGTLEKFKARIVAKGFMERYGIDYDEVFSPTAHSNSVRLLTAIAAGKGWKLFQDDQKTAFLHSDLDPGKWIQLPDNRFAFITKALYGLKEAPRKWFLTYRQFMLDEGFKQSQVEPCLFYKSDVLAVLHVNDTLSTGEEKAVTEFRGKLRSKFRSGKGGLAEHYLALHIVQTDAFISLDQKQYIKDKLLQFDSFLGDNSKYAVSTPLISQFQSILLQVFYWRSSNNTLSMDVAFYDNLAEFVWIGKFPLVPMSWI